MSLAILGTRNSSFYPKVFSEIEEQLVTPKKKDEQKPMSLAGAPVSRTLLIGISVCSIAAAITSRQYWFNVPMSPHLTRDHQFWRLAVHHLAFTNSSQFFMAFSLLIYASVGVERAFGSSKYASYVVVIVALSTVLETVLLIAGYRFGLEGLPSGPLAFALATGHQCVSLAPPTFIWRIFGFEFTNAIMLYLFMLQLTVSCMPGTLIVSLVGIVASMLYRGETIGPALRAYRLPPQITAYLSQDPTPPGQRPFLALYNDVFAHIGFVRPTNLFTPHAATPYIPPRSAEDDDPSFIVIPTTAQSPPAHGNQSISDDILDLQAIVPNATEEQITRVLAESEGNVHIATERLIRAERSL